MRKLVQMLREETGSSMILALVFLLFCLFTGGTVLAAASANAGRFHQMTQAEWNHRSAMMLMAGMLGESEEVSLQLTIRDVTVTGKNGSTKRTVRYLATGGETVLHELLIARAAADYEASFGIPDSRKLLLNGRERSFPDVSADASGAIALILDFSILEEPETLSLRYVFSEEGDFSVAMDADDSLVLTLACVAGKESSRTVVANGITSVVRTSVRYWEGPWIGKGGSHEET